MKILFDNVDLASTSGPNSFAAKLAFALRARGHTIVSMIGANQGTPFDVALAFIQHGVSQGFDKPIVARLGGMHYMNDPRLSWEQNNAGNFTLYQMAEHVIFQNAWCKGLYSSVIYPLDNSETTTISNGTDLIEIREIEPERDHGCTGKLWVACSTWRPNKRLLENVRFFKKHRGPNDRLVIIGDTSQALDWKRVAAIIKDLDVAYIGSQPWRTQIAWMKAADYFIHLALNDANPNVVVDAAACGCDIICASSGGTHTIPAKHMKVVPEADGAEWWYRKSMEEIDVLYPALSANAGWHVASHVSYLTAGLLDIKVTARQYEQVLQRVVDEQ